MTDTAKARLHQLLDQGKSKSAAIKVVVQEFRLWPGYVSNDFVKASKDLSKDAEDYIQRRKA